MAYKVLWSEIILVIHHHTTNHPHSVGLLGFPPMLMPGFTCVARFSWRGGLAAAIHGTTQPHIWQLIGAGCWPRHLGFPQRGLLPSSMLDWLLYAVLSKGASPSAQTLIRPLLVPCLPMSHWPELVSRPNPESTWWGMHKGVDDPMHDAFLTRTNHRLGQHSDDSHLNLSGTFY